MLISTLFYILHCHHHRCSWRLGEGEEETGAFLTRSCPLGRKGRMAATVGAAVTFILR